MPQNLNDLFEKVIDCIEKEKAEDIVRLLKDTRNELKEAFYWYDIRPDCNHINDVFRASRNAVDNINTILSKLER